MRVLYSAVAVGVLLLASHAPSYAQSSLDIRVAGDARSARKILELRLQQQSNVDPKEDFEKFLKCKDYSIGYSNPRDFVLKNDSCYKKNQRLDGRSH